MAPVSSVLQRARGNRRPRDRQRAERPEFSRRDVPPITVFSADHGDLGGAHGLPYKGPAMYEELVGVPLVISWPGSIRAARSDALVSLIDVLPTVCDLAGVPSPSGHRRRVASSGPRTARSSGARDGLRRVLRQAVLARPDPHGAYGALEIRPVRDATAMSCTTLAADPGELRNLAADPSAATEKGRLSAELDRWIVRTADPFPGLTATDRSGAVVASPITTR